MPAEHYSYSVSRASRSVRCGLSLWVALCWMQPSAVLAQQLDQEAVLALRAAETLLEQEDYAGAAEKALEAAKLQENSPVVQQRAAEIAYLSGHPRDSLPLFQRVIELAPASAPQNWQRGIALCSCGKFEEGAAQFKIHHDVNPDDVENSAWYFLCIAKTKGVDAARETVIPSRGDGREPMMTVLKMLQGTVEPKEVIKAAEKNTSTGARRKRAQFYADLYVGLYYDSLGDQEQAVKYLKRSQRYGIDGYMADTARVYLASRFPKLTKADSEEPQ